MLRGLFKKKWRFEDAVKLQKIESADGFTVAQRTIKSWGVSLLASIKFQVDLETLRPR